MRTCVRCGARLDGADWDCDACGWAPQVRDGVQCLAPDVVTGEGFDPAAFDRLAATEDTSFWFRGRNKLIQWALNEAFPTAGSLLEIGCGTGYVLAALREARPGLRLAGAELYAAGLRHARERLPDAEFIQLDATCMPYEREWDVVGAFDVLEHIPDDRAALAGMYRATRPGGGVLITVPQHPWLWSAADEYARHARRYRRQELVAKVREAGFDVRRVTSFVTLLLPAMYASRWRERRGVAPYDPSREHVGAARVPGLELTLDLERRLIRRGVDLPVGGSLLLVGARR